MMIIWPRRDAARRGPVPRSGGVTLIELMITLVILAAIVTFAIPNFNDAVLGARLSSHAGNLLASMQIARGEAIKRNATITVCASSNGTSCASTGSWEQGWIVLAGTTVLQRQEALPTGFRVIQSGSLASISFPPTVVGTTQATFNICRHSPVGKQERALNLSPTGVASITRTYNATCP
jgi:type IV fimbrial biogenesis protein FimT